MRFLSARIEDAIVERKSSYALCRFDGRKTPIIGIALFRTSFVQEVLELSGRDWAWSDRRLRHRSVCAGGLFAYVPGARIHNRSAMTRRLHLAKLRRNVRDKYLRHALRRRGVYADWGKSRQIAPLLLWVLYANLVVPGVAYGVFRALRHRDPALLYEGWATTVGTDYVLFQFLRDPAGKRLLRRGLASLLLPARASGSAR